MRCPGATQSLVLLSTFSDAYNIHEDVPLVELLYLIFIRMPGESYRRRLQSLLYLCYVKKKKKEKRKDVDIYDADTYDV